MYQQYSIVLCDHISLPTVFCIPKGYLEKLAIKCIHTASTAIKKQNSLMLF